MKRPRGHRGSGRRPNGGRNSNFESSGPQGKIRGTAYQVIEKYQALGRDALTFGDRVAAENYFQHAEHYYRVMEANGGAEQRGGRNPGQPQNRSLQYQVPQPRPQTPATSEAEIPAPGQQAKGENAVSAIESEQGLSTEENTSTEETNSEKTEVDGPAA